MKQGNNAFTSLEKARLSEWIGDTENALLAYNDNLKFEMSETFRSFIEPIIEERQKRLEEVKEKEKKKKKVDNELIFNSDGHSFRYSIRVIDKVQSHVFIQIRGYDEKMRLWDIQPLSTDIINKLLITQQYPSNENNQSDYEYQDDILVLMRIKDEMNWGSLTLDKNGILFGEAVVNIDHIENATKYLNLVLISLEKTRI